MSAAAPWRSALLKSLDLNKELKYSTFFQLATVRPNGKPANRTMVYRGFVGESTKLTFTTDSRYTGGHNCTTHEIHAVCQISARSCLTVLLIITEAQRWMI